MMSEVTSQKNDLIKQHRELQ